VAIVMGLAMTPAGDTVGAMRIRLLVYLGFGYLTAGALRARVAIMGLILAGAAVGAARLVDLVLP
jgi:hypothetical protein